jgi:squalene-hopene/tetraprenyl-beta-curcumene cyclase
MFVHENFFSSNTISNAIMAAQQFITENLNSDGLWSDFLTLAGESVFWVSGYVAYSLTEGKSVLEEKKLVESIATKILNNQSIDGGWSYGYGVPSDADSTSWCLLFLSKIDGKTQEKQKGIEFLRVHQSLIDGGFRTYGSPEAVGSYMRIDSSVSFKGWASSQTCVSAVAAQALIENHSTKSLDEVVNYIRNAQTSEGYWNSYWWTGKLYATAHSIKALNKNGDQQDAEAIIKAQNWILQTQLLDGSWSDSPEQESGRAFSTGLALSGLLSSPKTVFDAQIKKAIRWLIENQLPDGSWASHHILRIPYPWTKDPWNQQSWTAGGKAINAVIKDHRRLFTTATVFAALNEYNNRLKDKIL